MRTAVVACIIYFLNTLASGHISWTFPPPRTYGLDFLDNLRTPAPCGMPRGISQPYPLLGGISYKFSWEIAYPHRGGYRLELLDENYNLVKVLAPEEGSTGLFVASEDPTTLQREVKLPEIDCPNCVLRVVRQAAEWFAPGKPFGYLFRSCADITIAKAVTKREMCNMRGSYNLKNHLCNCDRLYYGDYCQYQDECATDKDCNFNGKCIDINSISAPRRQCFCKAGSMGRNCESRSNVRNSTFDSTLYQSRQLADGVQLMWRKIGNEIEFVAEVETNSWVAIGLRNPETTAECKNFPFIPTETVENAKEIYGDLIQGDEPSNEVESETEAEAESKDAYKSKPEAEPESEPEGDAENEAQYRPEVESDSEPESYAEGESNSEPESYAEGKAESEPESDAEGMAESEPESYAEGKAESEPESDAEVEAESEPETETKSYPEGKSEPETEAVSEGEPEGEPEGVAEGEPEGKAEGSGSGQLHPMDCTDIVFASAVGDLGRVRDMYTRDRSTPKIDEFYNGRQSLRGSHAFERGGVTTVIFRRTLLGLHQTDADITDVFMNVIWARGQDPQNPLHRPKAGLETASSVSIKDYYREDELKYHGHTRMQRGTARINFIASPVPTRSGVVNKPNCDNGSFETDGYKATWNYDQERKGIKFTVKSRDGVNDQRWTGIGFSQNQAMIQSDIVIAIGNTVQDTFADGYAPPSRDPVSELQAAKSSVEDGVRTVTFVKPLITKDRSVNFDFNQPAGLYFLFPVSGGPVRGNTVSRHSQTPIISEKAYRFDGCDN